MKNLIRTYIYPMLEDRLKLLAESSEVLLSSLTAELIYQGIENTTTGMKRAKTFLITSKFFTIPNDVIFLTTNSSQFNTRSSAK